LLAHRRILGAAYRAAELIAGNADVAADAFADVLEPPLLDLLRQERIGDRGPGRADEVEHALLDERYHVVGRGVAADADDRLRRHALDEADIGLLVALLGKARGLAVILPGADIDVPEIGELGQHLDDLAPLAGAGDALGAEQLVDGDAQA